MANELTLASLIANGGGVSEVLAGLVLEQLYDPTDLRSLVRFVPWTAGGSNAMTVTLDAVPGAYAAATSEILGGISNTAYTTDEFVLTIARYAKKYQVTDLFDISGSPVRPEMVAAKLVDGVGLTMTDLIATLFGSVSNSNGDAGTTGTAITVDKLYDAIYILNLSNVASGDGQPLTFVGPAKAHNQILASLRGETYETAETTAALAARGSGFKFRWNNILFYQSDSCPTINAGADYASCLFGQDAFAYTLGPVDMLNTIPAQNVLMRTPEYVLELDRDADNGMTSIVGNMYPAVSAVNADAACLVIGSV